MENKEVLTEAEVESKEEIVAEAAPEAKEEKAKNANHVNAVVGWCVFALALAVAAVVAVVVIGPLL